MIQKIKILENYADRIVQGLKEFEVRYNDRDYQVGDILEFTVIDENGNENIEHLLNKSRHRVTYIHTGLGMADGYVILGIVSLSDTTKNQSFYNDCSEFSVVHKELNISVRFLLSPQPGTSGLNQENLNKLKSDVVRDIKGMNLTIKVNDYLYVSELYDAVLDTLLKYAPAYRYRVHEYTPFGCEVEV